ncbi:MAG: glyoxalase I [Smithella sp. PtaU1.Bin162]|nr:MAG: glyoxalase I [Smithella sp. PtaU1.Bin162]
MPYIKNVENMKSKFTHTNIVARDWRRLAEFYKAVFNCKEILPERDLSGKWLDDLTSIESVHIEGIYLVLPGYDKNGPTLEIFQYGENLKNDGKRIYTEGFGHIAFSVDDVEKCLEEVKKNGGSSVGKVVEGDIRGTGRIHVVYAKDPEGNIIELQKWE